MNELEFSFSQTDKVSNLFQLLAWGGVCVVMMTVLLLT